MEQQESVSEIYIVVANLEEQYSIWPDAKTLPAGWRDTGMHGTKSDCLSYIEEVWTDMRPLSLRVAIERGRAEPDDRADA
jgi:MbtH protein